MLLVAAQAARASASLDVAGEVVSAAPLEVRIVVRNPGVDATGPLDVIGELGTERREARVAGGVPPGGAASVLLAFDSLPARPGVHALLLLLEHPVEGTPDAAGNPPVRSQRAYVLLALGARPAPAVRLETDPSSIDVQGTLDVRLRSADGAAHRMELRAVPARGLRFEGEPVEVSVPADGVVDARLPIVRAGAARGSRNGVLVVAESPEGPLARTTVAAAAVDVAPDPAWMPRLRLPLLALGAVLLVLAAAAEVRARRGRP